MAVPAPLERLFFAGAVFQMVPFIKAIGRYEAAALAPSLTESRLLSSSFAAGVDEFGADFHGNLLFIYKSLQFAFFNILSTRFIVKSDFMMNEKTPIVFRIMHN